MNEIQRYISTGMGHLSSTPADAPMDTPVVRFLCKGGLVGVCSTIQVSKPVSNTLDPSQKWLSTASQAVPQRHSFKGEIQHQHGSTGSSSGLIRSSKAGFDTLDLTWDCGVWIW